MARPKRFSEKLVVGLTPEIKEFLQKEAEKECCEMNAIVRRAILEYMEKKERQLKKVVSIRPKTFTNLHTAKHK